MDLTMWAKLALMNNSHYVLGDWRRLFGDDFKHIQPFLMECVGVIGGSIPWPEDDCRLDVVKRGDHFLGYPEDGVAQSASEIKKLKLADVVMRRLDRDVFERALCSALDLTPATTPEHVSDGARLIGTSVAGAVRKRVYMIYGGLAEDAMKLCVEVLLANRQPCCLVLPSFFPSCDEFLRRSDYDMIVLDEDVAFSKKGLVAKRREKQRAGDELHKVDVVGDYMALKLPDGTVIDLSKSTKCRAFVRHLHQRRMTTGKCDFLYDEEVKNLNAGQKRILIQSADFKFGLCRGFHKHFDHLFTAIDQANGKYRIDF